VPAPCPPFFVGPHAGDYAVTGGTCAGQTLAPNAICTVQVRFTANTNVSNRTAQITTGGGWRDAYRLLNGSASGFAPN
jgi:hypothetical protein